jgi:hypothetical protein
MEYLPLEAILTVQQKAYKKTPLRDLRIAARGGGFPGGERILADTPTGRSGILCRWKKSKGMFGDEALKIKPCLQLRYLATIQHFHATVIRWVVMGAMLVVVAKRPDANDAIQNQAQQIHHIFISCMEITISIAGYVGYSLNGRKKICIFTDLPAAGYSQFAVAAAHTELTYALHFHPLTKKG